MAPTSPGSTSKAGSAFCGRTDRPRRAARSRNAHPRLADNPVRVDVTAMCSSGCVEKGRRGVYDSPRLRSIQRPGTGVGRKLCLHRCPRPGLQVANCSWSPAANSRPRTPLESVGFEHRPAPVRFAVPARGCLHWWEGWRRVRQLRIHAGFRRNVAHLRKSPPQGASCRAQPLASVARPHSSPAVLAGCLQMAERSAARARACCFHRATR